MNAERKPHLYLAGPMTDRPQLNFPTFFMAAAHLRCLGYRVTNPAELHVATGLPWDAYLRVDLKHLVDCEAIAMLPGWQDSKGARLEHHNATELGMPVLIVEDLLAGEAVRHNGAGEPDLWVSAPEVERLATECDTHQTFALRCSGSENYLRGDRECNLWAFKAVKRWRAAAALPRTDQLLTLREWDRLHAAIRPEQSLTWKKTERGPVLCAFANTNDWAFGCLEQWRAEATDQAARDAA